MPVPLIRWLGARCGEEQDGFGYLLYTSRKFYKGTTKAEIEIISSIAFPVCAILIGQSTTTTDQAGKNRDRIKGVN